MDNIPTANRDESIFISGYKGFEKVYKQTSRKDFHFDWLFEAYSPEDPLPDSVDNKPRLVLWNKNRPIEEKADKIEADDVEKNRAAIFESAVWSVYFDGEHKLLPDLMGIRLIWRLLEYPNKGFPVKKLHNLVSGAKLLANKEYSKMAKEIDKDGVSRLEKEGLTQNIDETDEFKEHEKEEIKKIVYIAWDNLIKATSSEYPLAEEKWKHLKKLLFDQKSLKIIEKKGQLKIIFLKTYVKQVEKARSTVKNNIRNAMNTIEKKMPALFKHLKTHIKTGGTCCYEVDSSELVNWHIEWNN